MDELHKVDAHLFEAAEVLAHLEHQIFFKF